MDPYTVLGLAADATPAEAEAAYRRLMRVHHPDLHQDAPESVRAAAELRTMALNGAIHQIRTQRNRRPATAGVGRSGAAAPAGPGPGPRAAADRPPPGPFGGNAWGQDEPLVACPLCGEWYSTVPGLKAHLAAHGAWGKARRRPRRHRPMLPLVVLFPVNTLVGLFVAGTAQRLGLEGGMAAWIFALTLAPSFMRLLAGASRW
jgi:hypothetical protein